ncbi:MAG: virulence RhuM family protein [Deltaproteobacteria bacterium]|nr:virulence RhuM family protein [Deltaproteobacteria bacterium]
MSRKKIPDKDQVPPAQSQLLLYRTEDGRTRIEVRLQEESVWLNQSAMAELFQSTKQNISLHLKNIFNEGELEENRVVKEYLTTAADGKNYRAKFYNLEAIIAVGYRVRSSRSTRFRRWATERLNEYLVKGFTMDDERLKAVRNIGSDYFDELLERIRDIRSSEKCLYQKIRDIYKLAVDYDPKAPEPQEFCGTSLNTLARSAKPWPITWHWSNTRSSTSTHWPRKPAMKGWPTMPS